MDTAHKKHPEHKEDKSEEKSTTHHHSSDAKSNLADVKHEEVKKTESVVVSDVVAERVEVIEQEVPADQVKSQPSVQSEHASDPLADFKEKLQKESFSDVPRKKNFMWPIVFIFILALGLLGGVFWYKQGAVTKEEDVNVVTLSPTPTATPTPVIEVDLSEYEIEVLNGSGITGEAGRQQENLETEGFVVDSVGNADNSDYTDTVIQAKSDVSQAFLTKLREFLEESFTVAKDSEELDEDASVPVVIIIGSSVK